MRTEDSLRALARTVLYEGYLLWPYRRSALKNRHRFTIGGIYPEAYAKIASDRSGVAFDALLTGQDPRVEITVRFLRLVRRQVLLDGSPVDRATIEDRSYVTWDEAVEEEVCATVRPGPPAITPIDRPPFEREEPIANGVTLHRAARRLLGEVSCALDTIGGGHLLRVDIVNRTQWDGVDRDDALRSTLLACHVVARATAGDFVSTVDPSDELRSAADACRTDGLWPVLALPEPDTSTVFAAPIILEDRPRIAPESPGDLFDGGEIDELLIHNIRALTDAEREEIRATDSRAGELLDRSLALDPYQLARLHGTVRSSDAVRP
ncbi:MAG TPA: hypothetical protein VN936_05715 [Candidatus Acidoferrum sp.]|nr:hypothetical protein [Candidatus Acidoferrum sp.]